MVQRSLLQKGSTVHEVWIYMYLFSVSYDKLLQSEI